MSKETEHKTTPPRTDSLVQLLLQGLHNKDSKILDSVLDRADDALIDTTVRKLPVEGVVPLIEELQRYIKGRGMVNFAHGKWLQSVLQHHTSYLMSSPHCEDLLGPVVAMLQARTKHYTPLVQLKGKLDIMTKQIRSRKEGDGQPDGAGLDASVEAQLGKNKILSQGKNLMASSALLVYQDDSSDELSDVLDEVLLPASDTEEQWPNLSDGDEEEDEDEDEDNSSAEVSEDDDDGDQDEMVNGDSDSEEDMDDD